MVVWQTHLIPVADIANDVSAQVQPDFFLAEPIWSRLTHGFVNKEFKRVISMSVLGYIWDMICFFHAIFLYGDKAVIMTAVPMPDLQSPGDCATSHK
jgi:hypothetical protein